MENKKILITGGAGFIGSNLTELLINEDFEVTVLDNLSTGYFKNIENLNCDFIEGDINDEKLIKNLIPKFNSVVHLAAMVSVPESIQKPYECYKTNVLSTINILEICSENNINFIFSSSAAIYGEDKTEIKTEDIKTIPISPYGLSKFDIENICKIFHKEKGLNFTCFRNFNVYGPKQDINSPYAAVIPSFVSKAIKNDKISIFGDGLQTRDFVYVKDVCLAYLLALKTPFNDVYNIGSNEIMDLKTLLNLVLDKTNSKSNFEHLNERKGDIKHSRSSSEKFKKVSNWENIFDFDKGLDLTIRYYLKELK